MKINPHLVEWLKERVIDGELRMAMYDPHYLGIEARIQNLIEFVGETQVRDGVLAVYRLTALGEGAIGIPAASEPDTATGEYTAVRDNVFRGDTQIAFFGVGADSAAELLNTETAAVRAELLAARERIAALEARLNNLQGRMDSIAQHAYIALTDMDGAIMEVKLQAIQMLAENET